MEHWICVTCGAQYAESQEPPAECPICLDQRQYLGANGQQWTTLARMQRESYRNLITQEEPRLTGIVTEPSFAIGQRPLLVQSKEGNILWDCMGYLGDEAGGPWLPHVMFFLPQGQTENWGANKEGSPVIGQDGGALESTVLFIPVRSWSDGTPAPPPPGKHRM